MSRSAAQLVGRAGLAGIVAGDRQAAADLLARVLEPADVVPLPAVQRDRDASTSRSRAASTSTPHSAYCSFASANACSEVVPDEAMISPWIGADDPTSQPRQFCPKLPRRARVRTIRRHALDQINEAFGSRANARMHDRGVEVVDALRLMSGISLRFQHESIG